MRADLPRDNMPAKMRCGDPISTGNYLRMQDQSEQFVPKVEPSIPPEPLATECEGARVNRKLDHIDGILRQLDIALAIIYRLLPRDADGEAMGVSLDSFRTEAGPRAQIIKHGTQYDVCKRKASS